MKKTFTLFSACFLLLHPGKAQQQLVINKTVSGYTSDFLLPTHDNCALAFGRLQNAQELNVVAKVDSAGTLKWARTYNFGDAALYNARFIDAAMGPDSSFAAVGIDSESKYNIPNMQSGFCIKFKANGDTAWCRRLSSSQCAAPVPLGISVLKDSGFVVCGSACGRPFVARLSKSGGLSWMTVIGYSTYGGLAYAVKETRDSGFVLVGAMQDSLNCCPLLAKLSKTGSLSWSKQYCGPGGQCIYGSDLVLEKTGFLFVINDPHLPNIPTLIKTDSAGNVNWEKKYFISNSSGFVDGAPYLKQVRLRKISGKNNLVVMNASGLCLSLLTDSLGNRKRLLYPAMDGIDHVQLKNKSLMAFGNPTSAYIILRTASTAGDAGLLITDSLGSGSSPCFHSDTLATISTGSLSASVIACTLAPGGSLTAIHPVPASTLLVSASGCIDQVNGIQENSLVSASLYPNPSNGQLHILSDALNGKKLNFELYELSGKKIMGKEFTMQGSAEHLDVSGLNASVYFYRLLCANQPAASGKLVIAR